MSFREQSERPAKIGHRKSRNGCIKCKSRRVKCDEARPVCSNCLRLKMECVWPDQPRRPTQSPRPQPSPSAHSSSSTNTPGANGSGGEQHPFFSAILNRGPSGAPEDTIFANLGDSLDADLPESRTRRLLEHRLMQNYLFNLCNPFPVSPGEDWNRLFGQTMPAMGLSNDNLLYSLLCLSATHLLKQEGHHHDLFAARQSYLVSALREQRRALSHLSMENADAVCFCALTTLINSFAMLHERNLEPYEPPMEWLQLGRGAGTVIWRSVQAVMETGDISKSAMMVIANSYPHFGRDESYFEPEMRSDFDGVLNQNLPSGDVWDEETREAYEKSLSYIGSIQKAIHRGEPIYAVCRRLQAFALVIPPKFIDLLSEQRPRALVVLAHFFAAVSQIRNVWWLGDSKDSKETTAQKEIRAINSILPPEWSGTMVWPLDVSKSR